MLHFGEESLGSVSLLNIEGCIYHLYPLSCIVLVIKLMTSYSEVVSLELMKKNSLPFPSLLPHIAVTETAPEERNAVHAGWTPLISVASKNLHSSYCGFCSLLWRRQKVKQRERQE